MDPIRFGIVGGAGWRAQFFLRVAAAAPDRFDLAGLVVRDAAKADEQRARWNVPVFAALDELLAAKPAFVVVSVTRGKAPDVLRTLADRGVPALCETPPADDVPGLIELHRLTAAGARIQVAEQYLFQPLHAARLAVVQSGKLGTVTQAQVSACHGYHGISIIRALLGAGFDLPKITAYRFTSPIVAGPGRAGPPQQETIKDSVQTIARLDFGGKLGVYDFTGDQYSSWIRSPRILVRGERGEINGEMVRYLADFRTPIQWPLRRIDAGRGGNLEGYHCQGILGGSDWLYRNPLAPARLSDEEIAIGTCLLRMDEFVRTGREFYAVAQAAHDRYLEILIGQSADTGQTVAAEPRPWMA